MFTNILSKLSISWGLNMIWNDTLMDNIVHINFHTQKVKGNMIFYSIDYRIYLK
jgi:hypothetical protein